MIKHLIDVQILVKMICGVFAELLSN